MRRTKIDFIKNASAIPCVTVNISNGVAAIALIDSGSDSSLIKKEFVDKNGECFKIIDSGHYIEFTGLHSNNEEELIVAETNLLFNNDMYNSRRAVLCISDMHYLSDMFNDAYGISPDMLLGSDFLKKHKAKIDYKHSKLII